MNKNQHGISLIGGVHIVGDEQSRAQECASEIGEFIKAAEKRFDCVFMPCIQSSPDGNMGSFIVKPKPRVLDGGN